MLSSRDGAVGVSLRLLSGNILHALEIITNKSKFLRRNPVNVSPTVKEPKNLGKEIAFEGEEKTSTSTARVQRVLRAWPNRPEINEKLR